ncbi:MAG: DUF4339 domain-containing protein [Bdellovibrionales bacterium]|nr:DUF4339 domain-containing protein [Bdellovibrionales bacterium]
MPDLSTKKWFVYVGDHHEGPMSLEDIRGMLGSGTVSPAHFAWCEGMGDWKAMTEIPDFGAVLGGGAPSPIGGDEGMTRVGSLTLEPMEPSSPSVVVSPAKQEARESNARINQILKPQRSAAPSAVGAFPDEKTGDINPKERKRMEKEAKKAAALAEKERKVREKLEAKEAKKRARGAPSALGMGTGGVAVRGGERLAPKLIKWLGFLAVVAGGYAAYLQGYLNPAIEHPMVKEAWHSAHSQIRPLLRTAITKFPALGQLISPIPSLPDVDPADYEQLKAAALADPLVDGGKVALALSQGDLLRPAFHLAGNLPDGVSLDVLVYGRSETLLNAMNFMELRQVRLAGGHGVTPAFAYSDGKPLPRGTYSVYVVDSQAQTPEAQAFLASLLSTTTKIPEFIPKNRKIALAATFFLGGAKDAVYAERLKLYHDKLREKSQAELAEIRQFLSSLSSQFNSTQRQFQSLRKGKAATPIQRTQWGRFSGQWVGFMAQLNQSFIKWTPEFVLNNQFHGLLYMMTRETGQAVFAVHQGQALYFSGGALPQDYDIQLKQRVAFAHEALTGLQ